MSNHFKAVPLSLKQANDFVDSNHRHHKHVYGDKFRVGAERDGKLVGVVQVGRPVSRMLDDGETVEIVRLCTDGTRNACSFLYSVACKISKLMGYRRVVTYTLISEDGSSLTGSGFHLDGITSGGSWNRPSRKRTTTAPTCRKKRWVRMLE